MDKPNVSLIADALLACIERDAEAPHYREDRFRRKLHDSHERARTLPVPLCGAESREILRHQWDEVTERAQLTPRQREVVRMRLDGFTFEQIGAVRGTSKQGAQNVFFQAAKKLVKAWLEYPYRGLDDVYRDEVRRSLPVDGPEHSPRTP